MSDTSFNENLISAYLDGELSPEDAAKVQDLMGQDPKYAQLLDELKQQSSALKQLPAFELDSQFAQRVMDSRGFAAVDRDERNGPVAKAARASVGSEHWGGAIAVISALAALLLVVLGLPSLRNLQTDTVAVKAAPDKPAQSTEFAMEGNADAEMAQFDDASDLDVDSAAQKLAGEKESRPLERLAEEKEAESLFFKDKARSSAVTPAGNESGGAKSRDAMKGMGGKGEGRNENQFNSEFPRPGAAGQQGSDQVAASPPLSRQRQITQAADPFSEVNVIQVDMAPGLTQKKLLLQAMKDHQVELPGYGENLTADHSDPNVDAARVYYVLADQAQMSRFALDLSNSSSAVIAMYRIADGNREKVGQYSTYQQMESLNQKAAPPIGRSANNYFAVPMEPVIVKGGDVIKGDFGSVLKQKEQTPMGSGHAFGSRAEDERRRALNAQVESKAEQGGRAKPLASSTPLSFGNDDDLEPRSVQVYLLIVRTQGSLESELAPDTKSGNSKTPEPETRPKK